MRPAEKSVPLLAFWPPSIEQQVELYKGWHDCFWQYDKVLAGITRESHSHKQNVVMRALRTDRRAHEGVISHIGGPVCKCCAVVLLLRP